ncbi:hypothetical protein FV218_14170 [Methylobacterium sp. WL69]|uniref:hypothetical protein n=1 Tax=Methylobacterium sp. WL69 TaxID=2603893 RepID=UPI0011C9B950|nr:hypothetical protein [Methylobacterium sp. WL69]TXM71909.1 hypothetical protein FV218_14170 [Methylobacterium sp. WL69]
MNETTPLTWKSIMVLPALIATSALAVLAVAWNQRLSLHGGLGLLIGVLTVMEIGYLLILIAMSRRVEAVRDPWVRASRER